MGKLVLAPCIEGELWDIWSFIAKDNPAAATRVIEAVGETFKAFLTGRMFAVEASGPIHERGIDFSSGRSWPRNDERELFRAKAAKHAKRKLRPNGCLDESQLQEGLPLPAKFFENATPPCFQPALAPRM